MASALEPARPPRVYRLIQEAVGWTFWEGGRRLLSLEDDADALIVARSLADGVSIRNFPARLELNVSGAVVAAELPLRQIAC